MLERRRRPAEKRKGRNFVFSINERFFDIRRLFVLGKPPVLGEGATHGKDTHHAIREMFMYPLLSFPSWLNRATIWAGLCPEIHSTIQFESRLLCSCLLRSSPAVFSIKQLQLNGQRMGAPNSRKIVYWIRVIYYESAGLRRMILGYFGRGFKG